MSCSDWEDRIALYAGGDLSAAEASAVERHVRECTGCQVLLSGLRKSLGLLRETHEEPVDAAHYAAVRARVLSELERGRSPWWRHAWLYAMVTAAMVVLSVAVRPKPPQKTVAQVPVPEAPAVLPAAGSETPPPPTPLRRARPRRKPAMETIAVKNEKPMEPIVVKLITDDPDVIIYWITDTKGE